MNASKLVIGAGMLIALVAAAPMVSARGSFVGQVSTCAINDTTTPGCYLTDAGEPTNQCGVEDRTLAVATQQPGSVNDFEDCLVP